MLGSQPLVIRLLFRYSHSPIDAVSSMSGNRSKNLPIASRQEALPNATYRTPQMRVEPPPTEVSYSDYSPSPSDIALWHDLLNGIRDWKEDIPIRSSRSDITYGRGVGAGSAPWRSREMSRKGSDRGAMPTTSTQRAPMSDSRTSSREGPHAKAWGETAPSVSPLPRPVQILRSASQDRSPPVPLLALPPSPASSTPTDDKPFPPPMARDHLLLPPARQRSVKSKREAYLASALEFPLELIGRVDDLPTPPISSRSSSLSTGRLRSLRGKPGTRNERLASEASRSPPAENPKSASVQTLSSAGHGGGEDSGLKANSGVTRRQTMGTAGTNGKKPQLSMSKVFPNALMTHKDHQVISKISYWIPLISSSVTRCVNPFASAKHEYRGHCCTQTMCDYSHDSSSCAT